MTEAEWLRSDWVDFMLPFGRGISNRKARLLACAWCCRFWESLRDPRCRQALATAEHFADGLASADELMAARKDCQDAGKPIRTAYFRRRGTVWCDSNYEPAAAEFAVGCCVAANVQLELVHRYTADVFIAPVRGWANFFRHLQGKPPRRAPISEADSFRDVLGNPFRPASFDPAWRDATATSVAQAIYDDRAFDRLPILADALEDAGCTNRDILDHCRQPGEHVRGCWVVDLVLGKS